MISLSLSTGWNASRHCDGTRLIGEIRELGFETVELGHDLRADLVPGVQRAINAGVVQAVSVHNYCPSPLGLRHVNDNVFSPCALKASEREIALRHTRRTIEFAAEAGASWVVMHAGRVEMQDMTSLLIRRAVRGEKPGDKTCKKIRLRQLVEREKRAPRYIEALQRFLEKLLPEAERLGCRLALEIQPSWESIPTELELFNLLKQFETPWLRYWHDFGHGQVRENLGFINHGRWLERLSSFLAGAHVHDVAAPARDHLPPGRGSMDFLRFKHIASRMRPLVLEPHPRTDKAALTAGARRLREQWQ